MELPMLLGDLAAEGEGLEELLTPLVGQPGGFAVATPAAGWTVAHTLAHLTATDIAAVDALEDPAGFTERLPAHVEEVSHPKPTGSDAEQLSRWRTGRARVLSAGSGAAVAAPDKRVAWFGPSMSLRSFLTARLMETWAHGTDIADACGVALPATPRLRHIADLGVRTFGWSFTVHGRPVPDAPVRVELRSPDLEQVWTWGPPEAVDVVSGPAEHFCWLVTQRRHPSELGLHVTGPVAAEWVALAQAFAGGPGEGRGPRTGAGAAG